jgi:hypothetical protein
MNKHCYAILGLAMAATLVFAASAIGSAMVAAQINNNNNNNNSSNIDSPSVVYNENMKYCDHKDAVFKLVDTGASV